MSDYQICTRCVMDNASDSTIKFDVNGVCNYCSDVVSRMDSEYFPNEEGKRRLDAMMRKIKAEGHGRKYDCLVGVSGGLDSSYVLYLGQKYDLNMLAIHIDDGFDTEIAKINISRLCKKANAELINIKPDPDQYNDLIRAFFLARVPNLALPQDNILLRALQDAIKSYKLNYSLSGANFALESILERSTFVNASDHVHIQAIHRQYGEKDISGLKLNTLTRRYLGNRYFSRAKTLYPLNYIDYNITRAVEELNAYSGFAYYGGKHYESVLTRFLQCAYLPERYGIDKRKSHFSSMIVSGQMSREEALESLRKKPYASEELRESDIAHIITQLGFSHKDFDNLMEQPPLLHTNYRMSPMNRVAGAARIFRKYLG